MTASANAPEKTGPEARPVSRVELAFNRLRKIPSAYIAFWVACLICLMAILSATGVPLSAYTFDQATDDMLVAPCWQHLMGTDELGRDIFARVVYGSRLSISIGFVTAGVSFLLGTTYGAISGYCGGKIDTILMRGVDIAYSLPDLLVMILVGVLIGKGTFGILFALGLVSWMGTARLVRAQMLQLKEEEFVEAAKAAGQDGFAIVMKHLLPNAMGPIIVALTFTVPSAILSESTLSFIGLGLSAPECSWGTLASDGWRSLRSHPHLLAFPSLFIFLTVLSFNCLGDGLRDVLDPRTRLFKG